MDDHLYAVVMAGGIGSRLWPRSRTATPKQFLDLLGPHTMLQETVDRIGPLIPMERTLVVAGEEHAEAVRDQVPAMPPENVLAEPRPRGTAPCIGLAAVSLLRRDPEATMAVFPADHCIADAEGFRRAIAVAAQIARDDYLVTLGITPDQPHTGYGYIQRGKTLGETGGLVAYQVRRFAEKPGIAEAQEFVSSGEYYWNAGIFVWRAARILAEMAELLPDLYAALQELAGTWDSPRYREVLARAWGRLPLTTIDYGVMEKAKRVAVLPVEMGWDDVGNWAALSGLAGSDEKGNTVHGRGRHLLLDTVDTYVYASAGRLVAAVGLEGLIIVDTPDAVLICPKDRAQAVREVVDRLQAEGMQRYV